MGAQDPKSGMQERMRVESSARMENLAKTVTTELNPDSEKKRTERDSSLTGTQDPKPGPSMQEMMRVESSSRMENIAETGTHERGLDPKKQRSEEETFDSSLMKMQDPIQERMRAKSSTRMEKFAQTDHHEKDQNPGTKRTEKKAANFSLTEVQGPESGPNTQERMRVKSSTRMKRKSVVTPQRRKHSILPS